jgi:thiol:disulfide interchange protein DsbC
LLCGLVWLGVPVTRSDAAEPAAPGAQALVAAALAETPESRIRSAFAKSFPTVHIVSVSTTPWQGVYEAVTPEGIIYADATGKFAMSGKMVDVATQVNLTDARSSEINRIDFSALPFARAIKTVKGNGERKLAVFADPDCPYCKRLEQELQGMNNLTVFTFLFPLEELHPGATEHASRIWCAKDPAAAWTAWLIDKVEPTAAKCEGDPTRELAALGSRLQITGTPTLFLADGRRIPGLVPLEDLERELAKAQTN